MERNKENADRSHLGDRFIPTKIHSSVFQVEHHSINDDMAKTNYE
jgi:hypothetical protein